MKSQPIEIQHDLTTQVLYCKTNVCQSTAVSYNMIKEGEGISRSSIFSVVLWNLQGITDLINLQF